MALRADDVDLGRDRDLVERYQEGDPVAFDDLYRRYQARLHRFCLRLTGDPHEAEEVSQEAFVRALGSMDRLDGERRFYPWVTVIARRIIIDRHRKYSRLEPSDEVDLGAVDGEFDHLFRAVDEEHVRLAMANLGPRHREVLLMREARGMAYADIAADLDVPVTTVEALLHRARKALRREYAAVGGERRGFWALPAAAAIASRLGRVRQAAAERWAEIATVVAPAAVGAIAAAVLVLPGSGSDAVEVAAPQAAPVVDALAPDRDARPPASTTTTETEPTPIPPAPATATPSPPVSPSIDTGAADIFLGPEGTDRAADEAEQMPIGGTVGPVSSGADITTIVEDTASFAGEALSVLIPRREQP